MTKRSVIPVPIELIAVLIGTYGIAETYGLSTVGDIAVGYVVII